MLFSLLGKTLISHTTKALSTHLEKRGNKQVAEIEASKEIQKTQIENSGIKDELILIWFLGILTLPLIGETERFMKWAEVLSAMPPELFYIFGAIVAASFGIKVSNIFKK
tara:strand:+ start:189 stop:518 length:330 start_codon:yes stop_codon:yes gene_type:complete